MKDWDVLPGGTGHRWARRILVGLTAVVLGVWSVGVVPNAHAGTEPETSTESDGTIVARITVPAPVSAVRRILSNVERTVRLSPDVISVQAVPQGECHLVTTQTRGMTSPFTYRTRRCPTSRGWHERLLDSDSFSKYDAEWLLVSVPGGTDVTYRVLVDVKLPVPGFLLRRETAKGLREQLAALKKAVAQVVSAP